MKQRRRKVQQMETRVETRMEAFHRIGHGIELVGIHIGACTDKRNINWAIRVLTEATRVLKKLNKRKV